MTGINGPAPRGGAGHSQLWQERMRNLILTTALGAVLFCLAAAAGQAADLRVCADPNYLPFSNRAGQGFENAVASLVARSLGERLVYVWDSTRGSGGFDQFLHDTLNANRCDAVMDVPYASVNVAATRPYYVSSYVFVFPKSKGYDITSMDSPALAHLRIGYEEDTPAEDGLKLRTLIIHGKPFDIGDEEGASPAEMLDAIENGQINVGVTWEPAVGYYLRSRPQLAVVAVPNSRSQGSPEQYAFPMAMAARVGDKTTRDKLDRVVGAHSAELTALLARYGVKLYKPTDMSASR
ncbi:MAG: quinoprotein dehydrogenase-associated putative ABC transporter substrate-binding protein [Vulcanimicrobiaceae bacterium]